MFKEIILRILSKVKIFRLARLFQINVDILFYFITINISKLFSSKVDNKLIVLGGSSGNAFIGNTKYLYSYLKNNTDYKVFYFVKSQKLKQKLEILGVRTIYAYSIKAIKTLRISRFIFVTHGLSDIIPIRFSPKTTFIETWHGILMKKYVNLDDTLEYRKWAKILKLRIENDNVYDYFITPSDSEENIRILIKHFRIHGKKIKVLGYPRNDIFYSQDSELYKTLKTKYSISHLFKEILLYAPTFRDDDLTARFPLSDGDLKELNKVLKSRNSILLMKAHKAEKEIEFRSFSNIINIGKDSDIQELLFISDILITDYSSVYVDYLLLNKPILFFTYDYEYYEKENRGLQYDLKKMAPGPLIYSGKELIEAIKNISIIEKEYEHKRNLLNKEFNKYQDGKSTERLLMFLEVIK